MSWEKPLQQIGQYAAAADYTAKQFFGVKLSSGVWTVCSTAGERCDGVIRNKPSSTGYGPDVVTSGVAKCSAGGTISEMARVTVDSAGEFVAVSGAGQYFLGYALESAVDGDVFPVLIRPGQVEGFEWAFRLDLASITGAGNVVSAYAPGRAGTITDLSFMVDAPVTTAAKAASLNAEIGGTNVTGGVVALTSANCATQGGIVADTAVTAANTFTSAQTIDIEAASVTAFVEGSGTLWVKGYYA